MRVLIIDDEAHAVRRLMQLLAEQKDVEVVGTCLQAADAVELVERTHPDVCLLDVEMPEVNGLDLAQQLDCPIIFVTAHEHYALKAFDSEPIDFVVKPVERQRLRRALDRVHRRALPRRAEMPLRRLLVRAEERLIPIDVRHVDYLEAVGNYVKVHCGAVSYLLRGTLAALEERVCGTGFVRTHRSYLVNPSRVRELHAVSHGDYEIVMVSGGSVPFSRGYRAHLAQFGLVDAR